MENKAKAARIAAGLSAREAAELVQVATVTWQVWEGQTKRKTEIPFATLEYFRLVTGTHSTLVLSERERLLKICADAECSEGLKIDDLGQQTAYRHGWAHCAQHIAGKLKALVLSDRKT